MSTITSPCLCKWCVAETNNLSISHYTWGASPRHSTDASASSSMSWKAFSPPVRLPPDHSVQTNTPELGSTTSQDFSTPRPLKNKARVIHKEKLSTLQHNGAQGTDIGSSSLASTSIGSSSGRADSIPTAHVSPHPASRTSPSALRRASSTHDFRDIRFRSSSPPTCGSGSARDAESGYVLQTAGSKTGSAARRWNSYQNLDKSINNDFREVNPDPDPTLSQSRFMHEVEEAKGYSKTRSQSHLNLTGTGSSGLQGAAAGGTDNMQYGGYLSVGKDLYGRRPGDELRTQPASVQYGADRAPVMNYAANGYGGLPPTSRTAFAAPAATSLYSHAHPHPHSHPHPHPHPHGHPHPHSHPHSHPHAGTAPAAHYVTDAAPGDFSSDITSWQQRHQEQLRRQHYEATQPATSYQPGMTNGASSLTGLTSLLDPHKLDAVKHAADSIIREKDNIIEKQKVKIVNLERQSKDSESDLHKAMFIKAQEESDALHFKLREVEYENASLKAQLAEVMSNKGSNMVDLERQLGKSEYEMMELKASSEKGRQARVAELKSMQEMLATKDSVLNDWKEKYMTQKEEYETLERKMRTFDRYLNDLPTADDHSKKSSEVRQLREDKAKYKSRAAELERRLEVANKAARQKQERLQHLEDEVTLHQGRCQELEAESGRLRSELGLEEGEDAPLGQREELEELRHENERLMADLEKARKLLEAKHKKQQAIELRHREDAKTLEERLSQEESTVAGLKDELLNKEQHLKKIRASIKELGSQNQDLLEKNVSLEEAQRELERQLTGEAHKLEQRLLREMAVCFAELQSVVTICVQRAEGQDPNISVLLGVKGSVSLDPDDAQPVGDNIQSLKYKVSKIHELRKDIDNLRELISNKYAEDMGDNLNCTTQ